MLLSETLKRIAHQVDTDESLTDKEKSIELIDRVAAHMAATIKEASDEEMMLCAFHVRDIILGVAGILELGERIDDRIKSSSKE